jgi:hypothetical protein
MIRAHPWQVNARQSPLDLSSVGVEDQQEARNFRVASIDASTYTTPSS